MNGNRWARFALFASLCVAQQAGHAVVRADEARIERKAIQKFLGTYRYVGGKAQIDELDAAIEEVVSEMNFFIRGIARRRLREPNLPSEEVTIAFDDGSIRIDRPGQPQVSAPANGRAITWRHPEDGDVFEVQHGIDGQGRLYQRFEGERSVSRNRFVLGEDGETLTIHTHIEANRLPAPLRFRMSYRRAVP